MQDSIELGSSDDENDNNYNQFQFSSVISPKGRRLTKGLNMNTASHQSLAYSNSTYNKNQFTQRSPPLFSIDNFTNNQNVNTLNFRPFDRKESTFGSSKGMAIQFDKIKEESYLSNFDDEDRKLNDTLSRQKIDFPCFLSNQNSPKNKFNFNQNDSLNQQDESDISQRKQQPVQSVKRYTKITPSTRKQIKQTIVKDIKEKVNQNSTKNVKVLKNNKDSHEKSSHSLISNESKRSKSPLQTLSKSSHSQFRNPDQISSLKQKIKQLQYSLQVQSISTEQLRTKVSVLNELLEEKFLEKNGINFRLFKNSSPSVMTKARTNQKNQQVKDNKSQSNIDLYVEMKVMEKSRQQIEIQYERVKNQLAEKNKLLNSYASKCQQLSKQLSINQRNKNQIKTQTSFISNTSNNEQNKLSKNFINQKDLHLSQNLTELQQQKQNLLQQIEVQKEHIQQKDSRIAELTVKLKQEQKKITETQNYVKLFEEKEKRFTEIQRPKFISQIKELTDKLDNQREQLQRLQMENNLIQMQLEQGSFRDSKLQLLQSPQGKPSLLQRSKIINTQSPQLFQHKQLTPKQVNSNQKNEQPNQQIPAIPNAMELIMLQQEQLKLLKTQRDHFRKQYQSIKQLEKQNYKLRLKNQDLQNQLHSLHQLIEIDDQITF